jgi:hypothetical protein
MKRMRVLFGNRRMMVLLTLAILVLTATALVASSASFTAQSANAGNVFTAGALSMTNDKAPGVILTLTNMKPGDSNYGDVTLSNTGSVAGAFTLTKNLVGTDPAAFGDELTMVVQETQADHVTAIGAPVYTGPASGAISAASLGTWQPTGATQTHYYRVTVAWPATGGGADNSFMNASVTYSFQWNATSL